MPPAPLTAAVLTSLVGLLGLVHLAVSPGPLDNGRALLVAFSMAIISLVVTAGVLLARGRWARWATLLLGSTWIGLAVRGQLDWLALGVVGGGATLVALGAGPWLSRWLRHRPATDGAPPTAVVLLLSLLATPAAIGLGAEAAGLIEWGCGVWAVILALGLSRALEPALWAGRLLHPIVMATCALLVGWSGLWWIAPLGIGQTALLWRRDLHLAVSPLIPDKSGAVSIPPELVDPAILHEAGLDDRGAPREDR